MSIMTTKAFSRPNTFKMKIRLVPVINSMKCNRTIKSNITNSKITIWKTMIKASMTLTERFSRQFRTLR